MTRPRRMVIGLAGVVIGVGALVAVINGKHNIHRGAYAALALVIGWGFIGTGLWAWRRRPANNTGPLMIAVGFSGLLKALSFSNDSVVYTIGSLSEVLIYAVLVHLLLSFPSGRLDSRLDRGLVAIAYLNTTVVQLAAFVLNDPAKESCPSCPANPLLITHSPAAAVISVAQLDISIAVLGAVVAILFRRWRDSAASQRRGLAPVLAVGTLTFVLLMSSLIVQQADLSSSIADALTLALFGSLACLPFAFLVGLLRFHFSQAEAISSLVGRLGGGEGRGALRRALAEALGDPTLELAYWVPSQAAYVDADGQPMAVDPAPRGKTATTIDNDGRRVAAIVHDADLAEERDLVRAVGAAAALTLENERLDAELRANIDELRASRTRILAAGYAERQRLERDLHDGAQQRLMALGINLRLARNRIGSDQEAAALLDASLEELNEATAELRELARGIHPAVLTDRGLEAALNGLAGRSPVPVKLVATPDDRLPSSVESAVYFVVAEALTNVARYANARTVSVTVVRTNDEVDVEVCDDGIGGADPTHGSGLRGLSDRVAALDGRLELSSADGDGTTVKARIPCG
ncbi:MAG TPA: sensor histidine kinase [Solirubrobacteraceae bacterium]